MHQLRHVRAHLPRAPLPDNRTKCQSFQCHRGHPMKPTILTICTIACIALTGCGDVSYLYEGGAGITPSTNLPQEDYCDQGIAPGTVRCTADGTMVKVEICIGTKWVPNEHIWCDEGCDGEGNCKKPTAEEPVENSTCKCIDNHIQCNGVDIELKDDSNGAKMQVACNSKVTCEASKLTTECEEFNDITSLVMRCSDYTTGYLNNGDIFSVIKCPLGCNDGRCNECDDNKICLEQYGNEKPFCEPNLHQCVQCIESNDCNSDGIDIYTCEANSCIYKTDECKEDEPSSCIDNQERYCSNSRWVFTDCDLGCNKKTGTCNQPDCNEDNHGLIKCSEDGRELLKCNANDDLEWNWESEICPFGCVDNQCINKCGNLYSNEDGGTFYVCSERDLEIYQKRKNEVNALVISGTIECNADPCYNIPVPNNLRSIIGINNAVIDGMNAAKKDRTILSTIDTTNSQLELIKDITFKNINTNASGLIAESAKPITLSGIKLENINITSTRPNIGGIFGRIQNDNGVGKLTLRDITLNNVKVNTTNTNTKCAGLVADLNTDFDVSGVTIESGLDVNCYGISGGIFAEYNGNNSDATKSANNIISNVSVNVENSGNFSVISKNNSAGGLIGVINNGKSLDVSAISMYGMQVSGGGANTGIGGLIGVIDNSEPLSISQVSLNDGSILGKSTVGGLLGTGNGLKKLSVTNISINKEIISGDTNVGGLLGISNGGGSTNINEITMDAVKVEGAKSIGGLIGDMNTAILNGVSLNNSRIIGTDSDVGGVAGTVSGGQSSISDVTIIDQLIVEGKRNVGGLIGSVDNSAILKIKSLPKNNEEVDTSSKITVKSTLSSPASTPDGISGGLVGKVLGTLSISSVTLTEPSVSSQLDAAGGLIGYVTGKLDISSVDIKSSTIDSQRRYAGGIIGCAGQSSTIVLRNISNQFKSVKSNANTAGYNYGTGGLAGSLAGNITIEDVINQCTEADCVQANNQAAGFIGTLSELTHLKIKNVISEVNKVNASNQYAAGFIARLYLNTTPDVCRIENVISNINEVSCNSNNASGFIDYAFFGSAKPELINLLVSANIKTNGSSYAGFIRQISNYSNLSIRNILVNSDITSNAGAWKRTSNLFNEVANCTNVSPDCPGTDAQYSGYAKYPDTYKNCFNTFLNNLDNLYYVTPGYTIDTLVEGLTALTDCGQPNNSSSSNKQCVAHRAYKTPMEGCWFTDYIYQQGLTQITDLSPKSIPMKPYHPYSAIIDGTEAGGFSINTLSIIPESNNIQAVLDALNKNTQTDLGTIQQWIRCSDFINPSDATQGKKEQDKLTFNYDNLLCPQLLGERTCLKTSGCSNAFGDDSKE